MTPLTTPPTNLSLFLLMISERNTLKNDTFGKEQFVSGREMEGFCSF